MSCGVSPFVYSVWNSLGFLNLAISFPILGKFLTTVSLNIFSCLFLWSSSGITVVWMFGAYYCPSCLWTLCPHLSHLFYSFFFFLFCFIYFHDSIFQHTDPFFCLSYSTVGSLQIVFNLKYCVIHYWLTFFFFFSYGFWLHVSFIFSIYFSSLVIGISIFFSRV